MKQFPYEISELTHLKHLYLPDLRGMRDLDLGKIKRLPQKVNWDECHIFECADIYMGTDKPSLSVSGFEIFHILDKHPKCWEEKFKKFHFHVKKKEGEDGGINHCKDEFIFRDVYFHTRHFYPKEHDRSLEIYGSYSLPKGFESVLKCAECISLVDNDLIHSLSYLGSDNVRVMKGCWLERCSKVRNILSNDEAGVTLGRSLETLWISNLPILSSLYNGSVQSVVFQNLKQLYLDCCPGIVNVFPSSQLPENLETLHVQFCDKLQTLFECDSQSSCEMQRLRKLYLLELPELRSIGIKLPEDLEILHVQSCDKLQTLFECDSQSSCAMQRLMKLYLQELLELRSIGIKLPEDLEILHVQSCDKLQTLFECDSRSSCAMQRLRKLYLQELPELRSIGIKLPAELTSVVIKCPKLLKLQLDATNQVSK